jgi:DNA-binding transcriptional LysR family regulator
MAVRSAEERLNWDDVRVFATVMRLGSLVEAARSLRISASTAGRRLRRLEAVVGAPLFDRLPHALLPTAAAQRLHAGAGQMIEGAATLLRGAAATESAARPRVRVTATASMSWFVARNLAALLAAAPGVDVSVVVTRDTLSLAHREADIALRMNRVPERGDLTVRRLARIGFTLYAARDYLARARKRTGYDPRHLAFVGLTDHPNLQSQGHWVERFGRGGDIRLRLSEAFLRHQAIVDGAGVSLLPCYLGDGDKRLARVIDPPAELEEDVFLLVHNDLKALPQIKAVANGLVRVFRVHARALAGTR